MKLTLTSVILIFFTLTPCLALPDLSPRKTVIRPSIGVVIREDCGDCIFHPSNIVEVSRWRGAHTVRALLGFVVHACTGSCVISFSDDIAAMPSRRLQLFTLGGYPTYQDTWNRRPYTDVHKGTFLVPNGAGPATVEGNFGLTFPCPATTIRLGYEVSPVGDNDYVIWDIARQGFVITCGLGSLSLQGDGVGAELKG